MLDKELPKAKESENSLLGEAIMDAGAALDLVAKTTVEDFYGEESQQLRRAIELVVTDGGQVDDQKLLDKLNAISDGAWTALMLTKKMNVSLRFDRDYHIKELQKASGLRMLIKATGRAERDAYERNADADKIAGTLMSEIADARKSKDEKPFREMVVEYERRLLKKRELKQSPGLKTPFAELNKLTTGLHPGEYYVVAARPSLGKSTIVRNMATYVLQQKKAVSFATFEDSRHTLIMRMASTFAGIPLQAVRDPKTLTDGQVEKLKAAMKGMQDLNLMVYDDADLDCDQIRWRFYADRLRLGSVLGVIDYIQLMNVPHKRRSNSREVEVSYISKTVKATAKQCNMPLLAVAQLSRMVEATKDKLPRLQHLRESGSIEQDCDGAFLLFRPGYYFTSKPKKDAVLYVAKQRNGPIGKVNLHCDLAKGVFMDRETELPF
jgi:replicative DNA helicase